MTAYVFVIGPHATHAPTFERLERDLDVAFRELLPHDAVRGATSYDIDELLDRAERTLSASAVEPDAIVTYWDFPSSCLALVLCERYGLPSTSLRSALACEHKYWARVVQQEIAPQVAPRFLAIDPTEEVTLADLDLMLPLWLKPIKSSGGHLGFRVENEEDLQNAFGLLRQRIHRLGEPFNAVLDRVDVPDRVGVVDGTWAIAEELLEGRQCTLEGHVHDGEVRVHGVFDIHREEDGSTFSHYLYPSTLPAMVIDRMHATITPILEAIGYGAAAYNVEYIWDEQSDELRLLEINPRISQEHSELLRYAEGTTNLRIMTELALGREPTDTAGEGVTDTAGKFFVRTRDDAVVADVPSPDRIADLEDRFAPCRIELAVEAGDRLSELNDQESYSFKLAAVYLGGRDPQVLEERFAQVREELGIELDEAMSEARS